MNDEPSAVPVHRSSFIVHRLIRLIAAVWFGAGLFLAVFAAPAAFQGASNSTEAANVVGAMLTRWHYLALLAPLLLLILEWRRPRGLAVVLLFLAIVFASAEALTDMRIREIRMHSVASISSLSPRNPIRRRFGLLHGISSMLLVGQIVVAAVVVGVSDSDTER